MMHSCTATNLLFGAALRFGVSAGGALRGLVCLLVLTGVAVIPARPAAAQSALPTMAASAGTPVTAKFGALFNYAITQTDKDTNSQNQQFTDETCGGIEDIQSMEAGSYNIVCESVDTNGTYTWRVSGQAVTMSSPDPVYVYDDYEMVNFRLASDVYKDTSVLITKTVTLSP